MKVIQSIESIYEEQKVLNEKLKKRVDQIFKDLKKENWHYLSRIKNLESFALKLETGRVLDSNKLDDFFACTIVVENLDQINKANALVRDHFDVVIQRPGSPTLTHKEASSFQFDDLRLYAKLVQQANMPDEPLTEILFEIQIKTFLQHAWSIATHDLIYKSDEINWPKQRIAFQIKAILEQAEVTISGVDRLISLPEVSKDSYDTIKQKKILKFYQDFFQPEDLPKDLVRLCMNTKELMGCIDLNITQIRDIIQKENELGRGVNTKNLSPFLLVLQSIIYQRRDIIEQYINSELDQKFKLILAKELDISSLYIRHEKNIVKMDVLAALEIKPEPTFDLPKEEPSKSLVEPTSTTIEKTAQQPQSEQKLVRPTEATDETSSETPSH